MSAFLYQEDNEENMEEPQSFVVLHRYHSSIENGEICLSGGEDEGDYISTEGYSGEGNQAKDLSDDEEEIILDALDMEIEQLKSISQQNELLQNLVREAEKLQTEKLSESNLTDKPIEKLAVKTKCNGILAIPGQKRSTSRQFWKRSGNMRNVGKRNIDPETFNKYLRYLIFTALASFLLAFTTYYLNGKLQNEKFLAQMQLSENIRHDHNSLRESLIHQRYEEARELKVDLKTCQSQKEDFLAKYSGSMYQTSSKLQETSAKLTKLENDLKFAKEENLRLRKLYEDMQLEFDDTFVLSFSGFWNWLIKSWGNPRNVNSDTGNFKGGDGRPEILLTDPLKDFKH